MTRIICDTHVLLFLVDAPNRLSTTARTIVERGVELGTLACADITLWEIAMLYSRGRINNLAGVSSGEYIQDILSSMSMTVLPITAEIADFAQSKLFQHRDPADRLIAATALANRAPLITADENLRNLPGLNCIW